MKAQKYPVKTIVVGAKLYSCFAYCDPDTMKTEIDVDVWVVRSIARKRGSVTTFGRKRDSRFVDQSPYVFVTQKIDNVTWGLIPDPKYKGKAKPKNIPQVNGWFPSISDTYRKSFRVGTDLPYGMYTTVLQALIYCRINAEETIESYKKDYIPNAEPGEDLAQMELELRCAERELKALKTRITKERNKKKPKAVSEDV